MTYQLTFDCTQPPPMVASLVTTVHTGSAISLTVAFITLLVVLALARPRMREWQLFASLALVIGLYAFAYYRLLPSHTHTVWNSSTAAKVCQEPAKVVSGVVTDFVPMPSGGHAYEHFCVHHVCFDYSDFVHTGGFNNTSSHGGPIRAGMDVRISYVERSIEPGNVIVRMEVQSSQHER